MGESNDLTEQQMVFLDPFLLDRARIQAGLALGELANKSDLNYRTVKKGVCLQGVYPVISRRSAQKRADAASAKRRVAR